MCCDPGSRTSFNCAVCINATILHLPLFSRLKATLSAEQGSEDGPGVEKSWGGILLPLGKFWVCDCNKALPVPSPFPEE